MRRLSWLVCLGVLTVTPAWAQPSRSDVEAAMKKATTFMAETVAYRGGYVWTVSEDLATRWGEIPARPSQIWVQAGTPDGRHGVARRLRRHARPLLPGCGEDARPTRSSSGSIRAGAGTTSSTSILSGSTSGTPTRASQFEYGYEEFRHYYGNATNDDQVTSDAAAFVLRYYATTLDSAYRGPALKALDFVLEAQYPNGGWPQRYPLRYEFAHDGLPDYTSYYTLNDGATQGYIELLIIAYRALGDRRYFEAARRGADFLIAAQGPDQEAGWAEQYGPDMKPIAARTHEPAGYVIRESRDAIRVLEMFYTLTGDTRYLTPIPRCLAWYDRVNKEAIDLKRPPIALLAAGDQPAGLRREA